MEPRRSCAVVFYGVYIHIQAYIQHIYIYISYVWARLICSTLQECTISASVETPVARIQANTMKKQGWQSEACLEDPTIP